MSDLPPKLIATWFISALCIYFHAAMLYVIIVKFIPNKNQERGVR